MEVFTAVWQKRTAITTALQYHRRFVCSFDAAGKQKWISGLLLGV